MARPTSQILLSVTTELNHVVGVSQVFAQQFPDGGATRCVPPVGQPRIEVELGGDALERHEKSEDVDYQWVLPPSRLATTPS